MRFVISKTVIIAEQRGAAAGQALCGADDNDHHALHDSGVGNVLVAQSAAVFPQHGIQKNDQQVVQNDNEKRHTANAEDLLANSTAVLPKSDADRHGAAAQPGAAEHGDCWNL